MQVIFDILTQRKITPFLPSRFFRVFCRVIFVRNVGPPNYFQYWVRIQKPVLIYDPGKYSVPNCARLPNYINID
jgi:hypothetical protein